MVLVTLAAGISGFLLFARKPWMIALDPARPVKVSQYVAIYGWIALAIDLALIMLLATTAGWWMGEAGSLKAGESRPAAPRWFWPMVLVAMLLNTLLCWPRLGQSFWHDETYPIRNAILGTYKQLPDGTVKLREVTWTETFFFYKKPNHTLYSGIARAANEIWRAACKPKGLQFHEGVIRFPAFLAGIGSIATIALLLRHFGFFSAGVFAAFLSALHPWHIRYASEARAYAFVLLLVPLVIYFLIRAVQDGRWRWWVAFGAAEFLLLYFYLLCLHVLVIVNLCALIALWLQGKGGRSFLQQAARWMVVNVCAAVVFLPLVLPCVPQFLNYVKGTPGQGQMGLDWLGNFLSHILAGIPWAYQGHYEPDGIELFPLFVARPGLSVLIIFLGVFLLAGGLRRFFAAGRLAALVPAMLVAPAVFCYAETVARGGFIYEWYMLFLLPGVIALVAVGMEDLLRLAVSRPAKIAVAAFCLLVISGYTAWTTPQRDFLIHHSIQPNRESVLATRPTLDPHDPRQKEIITATFYGVPEPYDPHIVTFRTAREMGELVRRADAERKPLFINLGYLTTVEGEHAVKYNLLKNSGLFEDLGLFPGYEPTMQSRHVFRYRPGSAAGFDFDHLPPDRGRPGTGYSY